MECGLCSASLAPVLGAGRHWRWVLNRNQNLLGKSMLVSRRHVERVADLHDADWESLHPFLRVVTARIEDVFEPAHLNLAFLGNVDPHVHLHVIPRYSQPIDFAGHVFEDTGFPGHYAVEQTEEVDAELLDDIADRLRLPPSEELAVAPGAASG